MVHSEPAILAIDNIENSALSFRLVQSNVNAYIFLSCYINLYIQLIKLEYYGDIN